VPIPNDGRAIILHVVGAAVVAAGEAEREFGHTFDHRVRQYLLADPLQAYFETMKVGARDVFVSEEDCGS
jgi:hypothetical protein